MKSSIELLQEIIETSFDLLTKKLANGGIITKNEASFQLEFGLILKTIGQLYEFKPNDKFHLELESYIELNSTLAKSKSNKARVDILITYNDVKAAIELKFFKKANAREPESRYDIFTDIKNLEQYKKEGINLCYFMLATDHLHYVNKDDYSNETKDFDVRDGKYYKKGTKLEYKTSKPHAPITLENDYSFKWELLNDLYFLKLKI